MRTEFQSLSRPALIGAGIVMALAAAPAAVPDAHAQASRFGDRFATSQVEPGASAWDEGLTSRLRLISARTGASPTAGEDVVHAGIEITLDPKWKTYWSTPGDTGIAPVFSFARSTNVASVDVNYPMPQRFDLPGDISFGYENQVVFPVSVTPKTSGGAITLIADVVYGACEELCIPVEATAELEFTAAPGAPGRFADILAQWQARVPSDHDARLDAVKPMMRDGEMHLEVAIAAPAALVDPLLIAEPTGGGGRVYLGTPDRSIDGNRATFMFPVKTRRNHAGLEGGVEFAFTVADKGQEPGGWWAQRFEYLLLPHNGTRTAGDSSAY